MATKDANIYCGYVHFCTKHLYYNFCMRTRKLPQNTNHLLLNIPNLSIYHLNVGKVLFIISNYIMYCELLL